VGWEKVACWNTKAAISLLISDAKNELFIIALPASVIWYLLIDNIYF